jgi:predicted nucleic acid-binding protein
MAALVIDSSIAAAWCFPDERTDYANRVLWAVSALEAVAPRLWAYEVRNSVLMGVRRKRITRADAQEFFESIKGLRLRLADPVSYDGVFTLADRHGLTVYDAAYLDLALREGLPLASLDNALCKAAGNSGVALFQP